MYENTAVGIVMNCTVNSLSVVLIIFSKQVVLKAEWFICITPGSLLHSAFSQITRKASVY